MKAFNILSKISLAAVIVVAFTAGCDNLANPDPINIIDTTRTASIQGAAYAQLDEGTAEEEPAPEGTRVKIVLDSRDYTLNTKQAGVQDEDVSYTTELDGSGGYSYDVPVPNHPIDIKIYFDSFSADVAGDGSDEEVVFTANPVIVEVNEGLTHYIPDVSYN